MHKGDCTEHTLLLTTLARAVGIPARSVSGLVYMGDAYRAFGGHAWNEVVIDGRWVPVDATWGQMQLDAAHLRLAADGESMMAEGALGGAKLELVAVTKSKPKKAPGK